MWRNDLIDRDKPGFSSRQLYETLLEPQCKVGVTKHTRRLLENDAPITTKRTGDAINPADRAVRGQRRRWSRKDAQGRLFAATRESLPYWTYIHLLQRMENPESGCSLPDSLQRRQAGRSRRSPGQGSPGTPPGRRGTSQRRARQTPRNNNASSNNNNGRPPNNNGRPPNNRAELPPGVLTLDEAARAALYQAPQAAAVQTALYQAARERAARKRAARAARANILRKKRAQQRQEQAFINQLGANNNNFNLNNNREMRQAVGLSKSRRKANRANQVQLTANNLNFLMRQGNNATNNRRALNRLISELGNPRNALFRRG